jgi:hypothetical protein
MVPTESAARVLADVHNRLHLGGACVQCELLSKQG